MTNSHYSTFRSEFLQLWREYRFRRSLKSSDPKFWSGSVFNQKIRMTFLNIFGLKRLTDQELLEKLGYLEHSIRYDSKINQDLSYYTSLSRQYQDLKNEFDLRLQGKSEYVPLSKAIKNSKIKLL